MSVQWTSLTNIFGWVPDEWRYAIKTFFGGGVQVASFRTYTGVQLVIINETFWTCYTFFIPLIPILWPVASYTCSICKHKWGFNRADALVLNCVVHLACRARDTFLKDNVPVLS